MEAKLTIAANKKATTNVKLPINTHEIPSPFEVYVKDQYTHHNIDRYIRSQSHEEEARKFLIHKYKWNTTTFHKIAWDHYSHIINNLSKTKKHFNLSIIHHRLSTGKMRFIHGRQCPHYQFLFDITTPYDHYLQCPQISTEKNTVSIRSHQFWIEPFLH